MFLQETWLSHQDLSVLETIHCNYLAFGSSGMDEKRRIMQGRHFGGVAFLYDKRLAHVFQPITRSKRVIAARLTLSRNVKVILINAYFIFIFIFIYFIFHFKTYIQTVFIRLKPETAYVLGFGYLLFRVDDGIIL